MILHLRQLGVGHVEGVLDPERHGGGNDTAIHLDRHRDLALVALVPEQQPGVFFRLAQVGAVDDRVVAPAAGHDPLMAVGVHAGTAGELRHHVGPVAQPRGVDRLQHALVAIAADRVAGRMHQVGFEIRS